VLPTAPIVAADLQQENGLAESQWSDNTASSQMPTHPALSQEAVAESSAFQEERLQNLNFDNNFPSNLPSTRKLDGLELSGKEIQELFQL
jgi:hypothetical protein